LTSHLSHKLKTTIFLLAMKQFELKRSNEMALSSLRTLEYSLEDYSVPLNHCLDRALTDKLQSNKQSNPSSRGRNCKSTNYQMYRSTQEQGSTIDSADDFDELTDSIHLAKQRLGRHGDLYDMDKLSSGTKKHTFQNSVYGEVLQHVKQEHQKSQQKHTNSIDKQSNLHKKKFDVRAMAA
jgi:hypothetical protein